MSTLVVTDTSCLIALDRIGYLSLLPALFDVLGPLLSWRSSAGDLSGLPCVRCTIPCVWTSC